MMETYNRICIKSLTLTDKEGTTFTVERGREYLTSREEAEQVTVLSTYWVRVPVAIFAGEERFT
jgi:hypothetical protein